MNWDQVEGRWKELQGSVREHWGKLTDNDLELIAGKRDRLVGRLQQQYGYAKEQAEKEVDMFLAASDRTKDRAKEAVAGQGRRA